MELIFLNLYKIFDLKINNHCEIEASDERKGRWNCKNNWDWKFNEPSVKENKYDWVFKKIQSILGPRLWLKCLWAFKGHAYLERQFLM